MFYACSIKQTYTLKQVHQNEIGKDFIIQSSGDTLFTRIPIKLKQEVITLGEVTKKPIKIDGEEVALFPVKIEGPWSGPRVYPDLQAIIEQDIGEQLKAVEDQLKEDVDTKVNEELGLSAEENISSDNIEEKIEKEVKKGLGKLFGLD